MRFLMGACGGAGGPGVDFSDDFNRADSTTLGSPWTEYNTGDLQIISNTLRYVGGVGIRFAMSSTTVSAADQYVQFNTITNVTESYLVLRATAANISSGGYYAGRTATQLVIGKMGVGGLTSTTAGTINSGDVIRFEAEGSSLRLYVNATLRLSHTDATYLTGTYVGIAISGNGGTVDNFEAGYL